MNVILSFIISLLDKDEFSDTSAFTPRRSLMIYTYCNVSKLVTCVFEDGIMTGDS